MQHILHQRKSLFTFYFALVLISAFLLFLRNPVPFTREDIWGEDGRDYIAGIINDGFWKALYLNFLHKGYLQFFKLFIGALCLGIDKIFFHEKIFYLPRIIAITSYLIYALVFCLPILLFNSKLKIKYLTAIVVSSCFVDVGPLDSFLVFGRILNTGFLSIYLCFLLVCYRIVFVNKLRVNTLSLIDLIIFLCILTQPTNVFLIVLIYSDLLIKNIFSLLNKSRNITDIINNIKKIQMTLFLIGIGTIIYFLIILISDLELKSYGTVYGNSQDGEYSHKLYFGKFWFNQLFALTYDNLPEFSVFLVLAVLVLFTFILKDKLLICCLYSLVTVSGITLYWRPGLLVVMKYVDILKNTVYTMPSNLIFIFMSFVMLSSLMERFSNFRINKIKFDNILLNSMICIYAVTGLHTITTAEFQPTISFKQGLCLAKASDFQGEKALVKVPINPENVDMWLPEKLVECQISSS